MAYCLRSFVQTLDEILHPHQHYKTWILDHEKIPQIQSLFENATFLRDFLDKSSQLIQEKIASLEDEIMSAAEKAEDSLGTYITNKILLNPEDQSFTIFPPNLGDVIQVFEVAKHEVIKIMEAGQPTDSVISPPQVLPRRNPNSRDKVVGVTEDLIQLKGRLTARASKLDIIPIVGMGGTGKSTLARILYDELSSSNSHFDCCGWVTLSQTHNPQQILQTLLVCVTKEPGNGLHQEYQDLIVSLHKTLYSRRFLIVLDDIWSTKAWDEVQVAFPKDNNGSRIILTTRETTMADYVSSNSHKMHLLSMDDSWELLIREVFGEESCAPELQEVSKRIAINCKGLPLALEVIGGLLSQSEISKDFWEYVAYNISSLVAKENDQFSGIFSWSFAHLPHYLKPCFLYMGAFPEDHEIQASSVIRMLVAEGFLYPIQGKSLEESADIHLNALVERNLIFVRARRPSGKVRSYGMHDLLRDLCLQKAREKKFVHIKDLNTNFIDDTLCLRRVNVHSSDSDEEHFMSLTLKSNAHSFQFNGAQSSKTLKILSCLSYESSLLRVLNVYNFKVKRPKLQEQMLVLVNLRYLSIRKAYIPNSFSVLRNLQTLIVYSIESIATLLANMPQLRKLRFKYMEQVSYEEGSFSTVHENLESLSRIPVETLVQLLGKLPNLRKLWICDGGSDKLQSILDLKCFHKLESIMITDRCLSPHGMDIPDSLTKLRCYRQDINQAWFDAIGALPNLRILRLTRCYFGESTWEPCEGGFLELQYLVIQSCFGFKNWIADETSFPVLRHLEISWCDLKEIPNDIGRIDTLENIQVGLCGPSFNASVVSMVEEQRQFGNVLLQLRFTNPSNNDSDSKSDSDSDNDSDDNSESESESESYSDNDNDSIDNNESESESDSTSVI